MDNPKGQLQKKGGFLIPSSISVTPFSEFLRSYEKSHLTISRVTLLARRTMKTPLAGFRILKPSRL